MANCDSCNVVYINGYKVHEGGCPSEWRDDVRECKWCGALFTPEFDAQITCSAECYEDYYGPTLDRVFGRTQHA